MVEKGFELSEASNTPVMLEVRIRACHVTGRFKTKDNVRPSFTLKDALENPVRDVNRIVLPPASYLHEKEKIEKRWPAAVKFIAEHGLNEVFPGEAADIGIVMQGGMYNTAARALELLGLADPFGRSQSSALRPQRHLPAHRRRARPLLRGQEGDPDRRGGPAGLHRAGGEHHPAPGRPADQEFTARTCCRWPASTPAPSCATAFAPSSPATGPTWPPTPAPPSGDNRVKDALARIGGEVHARPPSFCTGCPERPIFAAMKLVERELGPHHVSCDIGCHLFSILPPFNIGATTMGYGLGGAGAAAFNTKADKRAIAVIGDGGFWHNGLLSSVGNAVFNKSDNVHIIVDNGYSAATGGQDLLSSAADNKIRATKNPIEKAVRGVGVKWVRTLTRTYDVAKMRDTLREALTTTERGPKVIVAQSECMLNKQRRVRPLMAKAVKDGRRVVRDRFGVDHDTCTGDHSCIRLSGCPSLTVAPHPDPLRTEPVTVVIDSCVGCGMCGEVAHAAVLCPSFYRASIVTNPTKWDRWKDRARGRVIGWLQRRMARGATA